MKSTGSFTFAPMLAAFASLLAFCAPAHSTVSCACEHYTSTIDGICEALPEQDATTVSQWAWMDWG
jgi:hypothetical protein